ncbi:L-lactate permease [Dysosmobacter sp.]|uniref:L-lactate permease n=1 Tax=Dysosmobacter sp. TaxID=2591382 RepID=UPI002A8D3008|nr:L-lactate permease [Dysosmobacter sp.]MDY3281873.1 L-lactate permease [Dysosmobacter sp.]
MNFVNFLLAVSPIVVVLMGILVFKKPAMKVAPVGLVWTMLLAFTYFNITGLAFKENVAVMDALLWKGIKEGLKIVAMVFGAFVILNTLKRTGAIEDVKNTVARVSGQDRRVQLVVVGMLVPIFLEGAAGAGAPAAIAAPFLVALGFDPITAIAVALLGDATPCSWGGAGLTTINGGASLVEAGISTNALNSAMVGRIHMFGALIIPFIMVGLAFGRKGYKGILPYLCYAGVTTGTVMFLLSNYVGPEVTSMGTGLISILLSVLFVKLVPIHTPDEFKYQFSTGVKQKYTPWQAMSPYIYMLVMLPVVRYGVPAVMGQKEGFAFLCTFGYIVWVDVVIFICGLLGAVTLHVKRDELFEIFRATAKNVVPVLITMGSLLVLAYIMQSASTGMMSLIAGDIANLAGVLYPAAAVLIGSLGSFVTGTGLGSNIMFAGMHTEAAAALGMNPITVFAGQNAGASLGNLICPNNTVAACATVGEVGNESKVMKKTLVAFLIVLVTYMVLALLYTLVLFPNFGM